MCGVCGCEEAAAETDNGDRKVAAPHTHTHNHDHDHGHDHPHPHEHGHGHTHEHADHDARLAAVEKAVLSKNRTLAGRNRDWFGQRGILALNVLSAPGSGKTTLLERTIREFGPGSGGISVIEGDQATALDASRIRDAGAPVVQINTGAGCHLDADMVKRAAHELDPPSGSMLLIENVGNLVCPALFDLGERARVVIASVTEGDDKPLKYPHMFRDCDVVLLNKVDLLEHVPFEVERFERHVHQMNPEVTLFLVSALSGTGMPDWYQWLRQTEGNMDAAA